MHGLFVEPRREALKVVGVATAHLYAPCGLSVDRIETDGTGLLFVSHDGGYVLILFLGSYSIFFAILFLRIYICLGFCIRFGLFCRCALVCLGFLFWFSLYDIRIFRRSFRLLRIRLLYLWIGTPAYFDGRAFV